MTKDNNSKGIILIIIAMTLFAMQDSLIKYIFEKASLYEIFSFCSRHVLHVTFSTLYVMLSKIRYYVIYVDLYFY